MQWKITIFAAVLVKCMPNKECNCVIFLPLNWINGILNQNMKTMKQKCLITERKSHMQIKQNNFRKKKQKSKFAE